MESTLTTAPSYEATPSIALIDAATTAAVARLLGRTISNTKSSIDGDISAFENFITAFLFFDKVGYLSDSGAGATLNAIFDDVIQQDLLIPLTVDQELALDCARAIQDEFVKLTRNDTGKINLFPFLNLIGTTIKLNSINDSGDFQLTGQLLGMSPDDLKSSKLLSMLYDCSRGHLNSKDAVLTNIIRTYTEGVYVRTEGAEHRRIGSLSYIDNKISVVIQSLNWLLHRTIYYTLAARSHNASLLLHPIRSIFSASNILPQMQIPPALCKNVIDLLSRKGEEISKRLRSNSEPTVADLDVPLFSAWIASKSNEPGDFIKTMLTLRSEKPFVRVRNLFRSMNMPNNPSSGRSSLKRNNEFMMGLDEASNELLEKYGVVTPQGVQISKVIHLVNWGAKLSGHPVEIPEVEASVPLKLRTLLGRFTSNPYRQMLRSAVDDIAGIPRLGAIHERITQNMKFSST
jgi:hypothetical protein